MALLERAQIELIDITDAQPAVLTLAADLSRVQTEDNGVYSPDYREGLVIIPTLYVGKDQVEISQDDISYTTNVQDFNGVLQANGSYEIKQNLVNINSVIITATITNSAHQGFGATAQTELVKLSSSSNKYTAIISSKDDRTIFTPTNRGDIELTATLYLGDESISSGITHQWYQNGAKLNDAISPTHIVTVDEINSVSNYYCIITAGSNSYSTSSITIMDKTDPYSSQIISSDGLIFISDTNTTELTCNIYQSNKLIEDNGSITYNWYKNSVSSGSIIGTGKQIEVTPQEDPTVTSVTYYCVANINGTETTSQITLVISPAFEAVVEPKQIFIPFTGNEYNGKDSYQLTFYLQFLNSIAQADSDSVNVVLNSVGTYFSYDNDPIKPNGENKYIITFTKNNEADFSQFPDSAICSINYTYRGVQQQQEFYFVKNVKGVNGEDGEDGKDGENGNGIDHIEISYARSNDGVRPPDDNVEGGETNWYPLIEQIPPEKLKLQFLWEKKVTHFTNTTETVTEYSVQKDGLEIEKIVEYYALGLYANKTGVYVKEIKYDTNGNKISVITQNNEEKYIFDSSGNLLLDANGNIIDKDSNIVFYSSDFESASFARLYEKEIEWTDTVPTSSQITEPTTQDFLEELVNIRPGLVFLPATEPVIDISKNSLWIKYHMVYINGTFGETEPTPLEEMNGLRLTASKTEILYNNSSIQSIAQKTIWGDEGKSYDLATYITQMPESILTKVISKEDFARYFNMDKDGLTIGKEDSHFVTFTNEEGFYIKFLAEPYSPGKVQDSKIIGAFDTEGLNVSQIVLQDNLNNIGTTLQSRIVLKGTNTGGWSWVEKRR